jgi:hypothetical protein
MRPGVHSSGVDPPPAPTGHAGTARLAPLGLLSLLIDRRVKRPAGIPATHLQLRTSGLGYSARVQAWPNR